MWLQAEWDNWETRSIAAKDYTITSASVAQGHEKMRALRLEAPGQKRTLIFNSKHPLSKDRSKWRTDHPCKKGSNGHPCSRGRCCELEIHVRHQENPIFPCVSLGAYLLPLRNDTCRAEGATCSGRSSMAGLYTGRRGAAGQMKKSVTRKEGFMQCVKIHCLE